MVSRNDEMAILKPHSCVKYTRLTVPNICYTNDIADLNDCQQKVMLDNFGQTRFRPGF